MRFVLGIAALFIGIGFAHAQDASTSATAEVEKLSGWYRYADTDWGCSDTEDNQYRAALGRYSVQDGMFTFGVGELRLGFYDGGCDLFDPIERNGVLELIAICRSEGEDFKGRATIERIGPDRLQLHTPVINSKLVACPAEATPAAGSIVASEIDVHNMCRDAENDRSAGYIKGKEILGEAVTLHVKVVSYSTSRSELIGTNELQMGAYVGRVEIYIDTTSTEPEFDFSNDDVLHVTGTFAQNEFWGNASDFCFINIVASDISRDGF